MTAMLRAAGERIRARREKLGLTQRDVANGLQVSAQAVSKWELGDNAPDVTVLVALSRLLGVSLDWLLGGHGPSDERGEPRDVFEATIFMGDLAGYSRQLAQRPARDAAAWVNGRLTEMTEAVLRHDGIPVGYMGDELLAFFAGTQHRDRAVRAAFLARQTTDWLIHVGLHSGEIWMGQVGHPGYARMDIQGLPIFVAAHAERWSKNTKSHVAVTRAVVEGLVEPVATAETATLEMFATLQEAVGPVMVYGLPLPAEGDVAR